MRLSDYLLVLRRRWWLLVLVPLVAMAAAFVISKLQEPLFRSEASYGLTPSRLDNGLSIVLQNSMNSMRDEALARVQLEKISQNLGLDRSPDWLLKYVTIQPRPDEWRMVVQVDYPSDPGRAQQVAQAIGDNMMALVGARNARASDSSDRIYMSVQDPARPAYQVRPQPMIAVLAGAVLGLILGVLLAFVLEALDNTLKTAQDIDRYVGLPMLGAIPGLTDARRPAAIPGRASGRTQ